MFWGSFYEFLAILKGAGGAKSVHSFKGGGGGHKKFYPILRGKCRYCTVASQALC